MNTSAYTVDNIDVSDVLETESYSVQQYYAPDVIKSPVTEGYGIEMKKTRDDIEAFGLCVVAAN